MKPNPEVCERCQGTFKVKSGQDRILSNGVSIGATYTVTCYREEVPPGCPFKTEHVVSQGESK